MLDNALEGEKEKGKGERLYWLAWKGKNKNDMPPCKSLQVPYLYLSYVLTNSRPFSLYYYRYEQRLLYLRGSKVDSKVDAINSFLFKSTSNFYAKALVDWNDMHI